MTYNLTSLSVAEAIQEISLLHPSYKIVKINPTSFVYFIRGLGSKEVFLFGNWGRKRDHFIYNNYKLRIKIYPDKTIPEATAEFVRKNLATIIVELSG